MNDWFSWNGKKCTEYGIHVLEQPPITIPAERATFTNVPGRPGSLTMLEGEDVYDDLILTAQCMISDPSNIRSIASYLKGSGKVAFANRPGGFYYTGDSAPRAGAPHSAAAGCARKSVAPDSRDCASEAQSLPAGRSGRRFPASAGFSVSPGSSAFPAKRGTARFFAAFPAPGKAKSSTFAGGFCALKVERLFCIL